MICFRYEPALHFAAQGFRTITSPHPDFYRLDVALKKVMSSM
jgi:hypothetical protein